MIDSKLFSKTFLLRNGKIAANVFFCKSKPTCKTTTYYFGSSLMRSILNQTTAYLDIILLAVIENVELIPQAIIGIQCYRGNTE